MRWGPAEGLATPLALILRDQDSKCGRPHVLRVFQAWVLVQSGTSNLKAATFMAPPRLPGHPAQGETVSRP